MPAVHFHGEVLPRQPSISVANLPKVHWAITERGPSLGFWIEIQESQIHVTVETDRYFPDDKLAIYMRAFDLARTTSELVAFKMGCGVSIILSTFVDPDGITTPIALTNDKLSPLCTAFDLQNGFSEVLQIVLNDLGIYPVLNDLIASITLPHVATVNCARAIEGIRTLVAGGRTSKKRDQNREWPQMEEALRIDRNYREFITMHSTNPRHGRRVYLDGRTTTEIVERSWAIMNRFLEYMKRANGPLPKSEFPELHG